MHSLRSSISALPSKVAVPYFFLTKDVGFGGCSRIVFEIHQP